MATPIEEYRDHNGETRMLARVVERGFRMPLFGQVEDLIPRDQWQEFEEPDPLDILDQKTTNSCNGQAIRSGAELARHAEGLPHVNLSAWYPYSILANGIDAGSNILQGLQLMIDRGTCRDELVPFGTINPRRLSKAAHEDAKNYRFERARPCRTFDAIMSEIQRRRGGVFSVRVGPGFDDLDSDGAVRTRAGTGNHAMRWAFGAKRCSDGEWAFLSANSWSPRWGLQGKAWIRESAWTTQRYREGYGIQAMVTGNADPQPPRVR